MKKINDYLLIILTVVSVTPGTPQLINLCLIMFTSIFFEFEISFKYLHQAGKLNLGTPLKQC